MIDVQTDRPSKEAASASSLSPPTIMTALGQAAADGRLWELWFTSVPRPKGCAAYIADALKGQRAGHMLPWAVRDLASGAIVGSTRYHDIVPAIDRVEIGYTLVRAEPSAHARQHHLQAAAATPRVRHARLQGGRACAPTTSISARSGRSRGSAPRRTASSATTASRRDGTVRDTVMYSILAAEWPDVRRHLESRLQRNHKN